MRPLWGALCIFLSRKDWWESEDLENWCEEKGYGLSITAETLLQENWFDQVRAFVERPAVDRPSLARSALGHEVTAKRLCDLLHI